MAKYKIFIGALLVVIAVIGIGACVSFSKFGVTNPFATVNGLFQVMITNTEYVEIQSYPKVMVSKPEISLQDYMKNRGLEEDIDNQMGALHIFY